MSIIYIIVTWGLKQTLNYFSNTLHARQSLSKHYTKFVMVLGNGQIVFVIVLNYS